MIPVSTTRPPGLTLYAFPEGYSLADWTSYRVLLSELPAPNSGYYTADIDESLASLWRLFEGAAQPSSWGEAIEYFPLNTSNGGSGAYIVTVEVTSDSLPVRGAIVTIEQDGITVLHVVTKSLGVAAVALDPGDYTVTIVATGFTSIVDSPFTVAEDMTLARSLTLAPLDPPTAADTCRVSLQATRGATGERVRVVITTSSVGRDQDLAFLNTAFDGETDDNGNLLVDLPWSSSAGVGAYRFRLIDLVSGKTLHDRTCIVPDEENAIYEDLV
jgi:hypothetical protein